MKNIQRLNILIEQAVKKSLSNRTQHLNEANAGWAGIAALFKNSGLKSRSMFGSEYYVFNDPNLGLIEFFEDGEAVIKNPLKRTTWTTSGGELFVDGEKIEIKKIVQQRKQEYQRQQRQQQRKEKRKAIQTVSGIDKFQTALDWLGLIPGYGDILDAVNAIIYFARGKYLEGMLSLIAIIPVVGSGLKLGYKGLIESAGGALAMRKLLKDSFDGNPDKLIDIYKNAIRDGKLDKMTLKQLADKGDAVAAMLLSGKNWMKSHPTAASVVTLGNEKELFKYMDDVRKMLKNHGSAIDDAIEEGGETLVKRGIDWAKGFYGAGTVLSAGVLASARNFLVKTFGFKGSRQMQLLKKALDAKFIKQVSDNPTVVSQMYKMNPIDISRKTVYGIPNFKSPRKMKIWLDNLKATNPVQYSKLSKEIAQNAANNKNFYYMKYIDNSFEAASMAFKPGAQFKAGSGDIVGRIFQLDTYRLSNPKNLDIVYNEFNDLAEKIGYDKSDDPNGIVVPAIYAVFTAFLGNPMSKINAVTGTTPTEKPGTKGPVDDTGEVPGGTEVQDQDPIVAGQDKIKLDFKDMSGRTTERLRKLEDLGYTEEQVTALKQELGIE